MDALNRLERRFSEAIRGTRDRMEPGNANRSVVDRFQLFRNRGPVGPGPVGRRRRPGRRNLVKTFTRQVTLLPSPGIQKISNYAKLLKDGLQTKKITFNLDASREEFLQKLRNEFPGLAGITFRLCKVGPNKEIIRLDEALTTPLALRDHQLHRRSNIYILPSEELPRNTENHESDEELPRNTENHESDEDMVVDLESDHGTEVDHVEGDGEHVEIVVDLESDHERAAEQVEGAAAQVEGAAEQVEREVEHVVAQEQRHVGFEEHPGATANNRSVPGNSGYRTAGTPTVSFRLPLDTDELPFVELSLPEDQEPDVQPPAITLEDILGTLGRQVNEDAPANLISVMREDVLEGGFRGFLKPRFDPSAPLNVKFSGERGIDNKGLAREFLSLALMAIKDKFFVDSEDSKSIAIDYALMEKYEVVGKIIAYAIVHRGPPPAFFTKMAYQMLCGKEEIKSSLQDVTDLETREAIQQILDAEDADYAKITETHADLIDKSGCGMLTFLHRKDKLVHSLVQFYAVDKHRAAVDRLQKGLKTLGVLRAMQAHPDVMSVLFLPREGKLSADEVDQLFVVNYSPVGSNHRTQEERMISYWRDLLEELEDEDEGLELLLQFSTGMQRPPPLGFKPQPTITFRHPGYLCAEQLVTAEFPRANTCILELALPIHNSYETFNARIKSAIRAPLFFGIE